MIELFSANTPNGKKIKNIDGYTFNPSLFKKLGAKDYLKFTRSILGETSNKDVSIEVIGDDDWFAVSLTADQAYLVTLDGSTSDSGTLESTRIYSIYDSDTRSQKRSKNTKDQPHHPKWCLRQDDRSGKYLGENRQSDRIPKMDLQIVQAESQFTTSGSAGMA